MVTADHNGPTKDQNVPIKDAISRKQVEKLTENCERHGVDLYGLNHPYQGIVHVIGPELGITRPGITIVCGDSHTSTHGAFGAIAFGIGTSEVEQVLATQCILQPKPKKMRITVDGELADGVEAKDLILYIISRLSMSGGNGYFVEYAGSAIRSLSMEGRMTVCNMSIEMGARGGMIAPDEITFDYLEGKEFMARGTEFEQLKKQWLALHTDPDAVFDKEVTFDAADISPRITYGTNPGIGVKIDEPIPAETNFADVSERNTFSKSLQYMGLEASERLLGKPVDYVFIGSCTNARIEDLRAVAKIVEGRRKSDSIRAYIVPGSKQVEKQAMEEGLDQIFAASGFELR